MYDYATVSDLEDRWRVLTSEEANRAQVLISDASATLRVLAPGIEDRITAGTLDAAIPMLIVCAMVKRSMSAGDFDGASAQSMTAGPFAQNITYTNPTGNMYVTKAERNLLGIGGQVAFTVDQGAGAAITCVEPYSVDYYRGDFDIIP